MARYKYRSKVHMVVKNVGHLWPDTAENRAVGRRVEGELDEKDAKHYGPNLMRGKKIGGKGTKNTEPEPESQSESESETDVDPSTETPSTKVVTETATK